MNIYIPKPAEPMTAGELRAKIRNIPSDTPVYLVTDKTSPDAWDEDNERWRYAHPLSEVRRERNYDEYGDMELAILLEVEDL